MLDRMRTLLTNAFRQEALPPEDREAVLPFELFLTIGMRSLRLFPSGPIEEFHFFQRRGVPAHHRVEFLSRLDPESACSVL